jgi:hypothetical protein
MMPAYDNEEWRFVPSLDGQYEVSNLGRVRRATPGRKTYPGRVLKPAFASPGYFYVRFWISKRRVKFYVHSLVAEAFLPPRPTPGHEINHRDAVKTNNASANLEWVTHAGNVAHARGMGLVPDPPRHNRPPPHPRGGANPASRLTEADVRFIRHGNHGMGCVKLARHFGVNKATILRIVNRKTWRHID